jgi:putative tryptophan/tyrosine transport system substrate-binding protein
MRRRIFLAGLICSCVVRSASAQHSGKIWRVAYLNPGVATAAGLSIYRDWLQRMGELGYVEGENLVVDRRYAEGDYSRLPQLVHELIELKPDAMLAIATPAIAAAQRATTTIPIIMGPATDPVGSGFIKSLAQPGGNITGLANMSGDYTPKTVELLRELLPQARRMAVLMSSNSTHLTQYSLAETAAHNLGLEIVPVTAAKEEDLDQAFQTIARAQCDALLVLNDPVRPRTVRLAAHARLPAVFQNEVLISQGGLASYGPDVGSLIVQTAVYIDRIFKGASPADLPVQQPTKFILKLNLKTAKELGLTIPPLLLARADEVIE